MVIKENLFFMEAICYAPLLNEPFFSPQVDATGLYRGLEMIAFPGTVFQVHGRVNSFLQVSTAEYPSGSPLFVEASCLRVTEALERPKKMPDPKAILAILQSRIGTPYLWGGNVASGVFISEKTFKNPFEKRLHQLEGVDCSGLLYEATGGCVPRNTSDLWSFGEEVRDVKPLDIFVLKNHVWILLNKEWVIESKHDWGGVVVHPLKRRLSWINEPFVIRRFL